MLGVLEDIAIAVSVALWAFLLFLLYELWRYYRPYAQPCGAMKMWDMFDQSRVIEAGRTFVGEVQQLPDRFWQGLWLGTIFGLLFRYLV